MLKESNIAAQNKVEPVEKNALLAALREQQSTNTLLRQENQILKEQVAWFRKQVHDKSSEKTKDEPHAKQGQLFNEIESIAEHAPTEDDSVTIPEHARKKKGRKAISKDLPRVDVIHD